MSKLTLAHNFDVDAGKHYVSETMEQNEIKAVMTIQAADQYEELILREDGTLEDYLNLAVLYWQSAEPGFLSSSRADIDFIKRAGRRYREVLDAAEKTFPGSPEIDFWRRYCDLIFLGEPFPLPECTKLLGGSTSTLVPWFFVYSSSGGKEGEKQARDLLALCSADPTLRNRYIISVIESISKMREWK
jgi:hypothetical protein